MRGAIYMPPGMDVARLEQLARESISQGNEIAVHRHGYGEPCQPACSVRWPATTPEPTDEDGLCVVCGKGMSHQPEHAEWCSEQAARNREEPI